MRGKTRGIAFRGVTGFATSFAKLLEVHKYLMECDKGAGSCRIARACSIHSSLQTPCLLSEDNTTMSELSTCAPTETCSKGSNRATLTARLPLSNDL